MSRDLDKISENIKKEEKKEDICNIPLSDYVKRLEPHVKQRYLEKISLVGIDPATLIDAKLDPQCLPPIEATDLLFGYRYELLHKETVQSFQKLGGLQSDGVGFYFQC